MAHATLGQVSGQSPGACPSGDTFGIGAGTLVQTLDGELPVEFLEIGDRIVTRDGVRVLKSIGTRVADVTVVIAADVLGGGRPGKAAVLAPHQTVLIRDWRAGAMFGAKSALVAVERLIDGAYIRKGARRNQRLFTLGFDAPCIIQASGLELGCPSATVTA